MVELKDVLEQEVLELETIEKAAKQDLKSAPRGTLRISKNSNTDQYYWRTDVKDTRGKYIRKSEKELIKSLAQKDYAQKVLVVLRPFIKKEKEELRESDVREQIQEIYKKLSPARQKLITPYVYTMEEFAARWEEEKKLEKEHVRKIGSFYEVGTELQTEKGEYVRSKSEKILADKFYMMKIPYVYEKPLYLENYGYIRPDFVVLNKRTRREYYWEHFGMMDEKEYCEKAIKKVESFEKSGIFPGDKLILTYETKEHPLNTVVVEKLIKKYLL